MITSARWGVWETNSSTMNQIAIRINDNEFTEDYPKGIFLNSTIDSSEARMVRNVTEKIQILWEWCNKIDGESTYNADKSWFETNIFRRNLLEVLKKHNIELYLLPLDKGSLDLGIVGLSGVNDCALKLFSNKDLLEKFIFDKNSCFTWGIENGWPDSNHIGYSEEPSEKYEIMDI